MMGASKGLRPATVVMVDDGRMAGFYQFAARLRRLGTRVVRITTVRERRSLMASRLVFDRCISLPKESTEDVLRAVFAEENVVDVQFAETLKDLVSTGLSALDARVAQIVHRRIEVMDKEYAGAMISAAGVATPPRALFSEMDAQEFAERHGFPIVIKERTGYGGLHVKIVESSEELGLVAAPYRGLGSAYLEKFIEGEKVNFGAVIGMDGVLQGMCYKTLDWVRPVGPSSVVEIYEEPALYEAGRRAVEAVGVPGLVNVNFMLDADGVLWAIDLNARIFGGIATYIACGMDLTAGYLAALGILPSVETKSPISYIRIKVFPLSLSELIERGRFVPLFKEFAKESAPYWKWLGPRYVLSEMLATLSAFSNARRR
jgi:biotin carboxylase